VPNIYTEIPLPYQIIIKNFIGAFGGDTIFSAWRIVIVTQFLIGTFGGETAYLREEYGFHHDIDGKRYVCFNDELLTERLARNSTKT
jgi:hypothetical protein